ncbi:MAG: helix-turn-helix transcriptional regulator, partial [Gemmobacter sp.]
TGHPMRATTRERVVAAFDRAAAYAADPAVPGRIRLNAVREVLLWLGEEGIGFGRLRPPALADRLRATLSADPGRDWRSAEAAKTLAVSEPTLRRHLAQNGVSFGTLLADVRMSVALGMLQSTDLPVNRVALDVGYACPSRFAVRFRKRFGLAPSSIRTAAIRDSDRAARDAAPVFDRIGIKIDRIGTMPAQADA